jgi:hypothetical protein
MDCDSPMVPMYDGSPAFSADPISTTFTFTGSPDPEKSAFLQTGVQAVISTALRKINPVMRVLVFMCFCFFNSFLFHCRMFLNQLFLHSLHRQEFLPGSETDRWFIRRFMMLP